MIIIAVKIIKSDALSLHNRHIHLLTRLRRLTDHSFLRFVSSGRLWEYAGVS